MNRTYCPECGQRVERAELDLAADRPGSVFPILAPCGHRASPVKSDGRVPTSPDGLKAALGQCRRKLIGVTLDPDRGLIVPSAALAAVCDALEAHIDEGEAAKAEVPDEPAAV